MLSSKHVETEKKREREDMLSSDDDFDIVAPASSVTPPDAEEALLVRIRTMRRRNEVLSTLCGLNVHCHVVEAAVRIQAAGRGAAERRRREEEARKAARADRWWREAARRRALIARIQACVRLQSAFRGAEKRRSPIGRAVGRMVESRREVTTLELMVLRMAVCDGIEVEQISVY